MKPGHTSGDEGDTGKCDNPHNPIKGCAELSEEDKISEIRVQHIL
jgi:hypothetical protein